MKTLFASIFLAGVTTIAGAPFASHFALAAVGSQAQAAKCSADGYKNGRCVVVPAKGTYTIKIGKTRFKLQSTGSAATQGSQVTVWPVTVQGSPKGLQTFKVFVQGPINPLKLTTPGQLYKYNVATGKWVRVNSITTSGIYGVM